jgi:hypothetical protein
MREMASGLRALPAPKDLIRHPDDGEVDPHEEIRQTQVGDEHVKA